MYADYTFYVESFYGTAIKEADFPRLASRSSDFLDYYTRGKASVSDETTALAKACCAIAEAMQSDDNNKAIAAKAQAAALSSDVGEKKSESVGSWSASYATAADYVANNTASAENALRANYALIAQQYLANTGLLYRGGGACTRRTL